MPRIEPKQVQKDLEAGMLWPVYWIHGQESMKSRELLKRIRRAVLGGTGEAGDRRGLAGFAEETLEGTETGVAQVLDAVQSLSLGGGLRFVVVRDAHAIKESEKLAPLLGPAAPKAELTSVCVFLSKDLDGRKKFSKQLLEGAAVVPCEDVPEEEREAWIGYLAKRRGVELPPALALQLRSLDPWTLDIVDQELEKYSLSSVSETLLSSTGPDRGTEIFLEAFLSRDRKLAMECVAGFADSPDQSLPLLGLLAWNARFLAMILADREQGTRNTKLSPFLAERFGRWSRRWTLAEALRLQGALAELDFGFKQTARMPLGLWSSLVSEYCGP